MDDDPAYVFSKWGPEATAAIVDWWRERWLARRIDHDRVLDEVAAHTLVRPVRHGARVDLPEDQDQMLLPDDVFEVERDPV
jgi:hypothetical protein